MPSALRHGLRFQADPPIDPYLDNGPSLGIRCSTLQFNKMPNSYSGRNVTDAARTFLIANKLGAHEFAALKVLWNTSMQPASLIRHSMISSRDSEGFNDAAANEWSLTRADAETSVVRLFDRRILHLVNSHRQFAIRRKLESSPSVFYTPDQIPQIGDVDLTPAGIRLAMTLYRTILDWTDFTDCAVFHYEDETTVQICATSEPYLKSAVPDLSSEFDGQSPTVGPITRVGRWRDRWWRTRKGGVTAKVTWGLDSSMAGNHHDPRP
jgi:hypothetical protein